MGGNLASRGMKEIPDAWGQSGPELMGDQKRRKRPVEDRNQEEQASFEADVNQREFSNQGRGFEVGRELKVVIMGISANLLIDKIIPATGTEKEKRRLILPPELVKRFPCGFMNFDEYRLKIMMQQRKERDEREQEDKERTRRYR